MVRRSRSRVVVEPRALDTPMLLTPPTLEAYAARMNFTGYMIEGTCDDQALMVRGKNKAARIALAGEGHADGDVVIPRASIAAVNTKEPSMMVNGKVVVTTTAGQKVQMHFRKKQHDDWAALARALAG